MTSPDLVRAAGEIPEPFLLVAADTTILSANQPAAMLFGRSVAELQAKQLASLVADDSAKLGRYLRLCRRTPAGMPGGMRVRDRGGEAILCRALGGLARRDDGGAVVWLRLSPPDTAIRNEGGQEPRGSGAALATSEERFRLLVESVNDYAIFLLDADGRIVTWNAGAERIMGYRRAEVLGRHASIFYTREDSERGKPEQELRDAAVSGRAEHEGWRRRKDGSEFWANVVSSALRSNTGSIIGYSKVTRDLTGQRRADEALRLQVNVLQCMPCIAWTLTADGANDFVNRQWLEYTGQTEEAFRNEPQTWMHALHPEDRESASRLFWEGIHSGRGYTFESRFRRESDGSYRWHLNRAVPVHDSAGNPVKFVGTSTDIEALKRAGEELHNAGEHTRMIVDSALDAVVTIDSEGKITGWNRQAERQFGWRSEEVIGQPMADIIIRKGDRDAHTRGFRHFLETGEGPILNRRVEVTALRRDGSEFPVELTVSAAQLGGGWTFSAFVRDISERKLAEEQLRASERNLRLMTETIPEMLWSATPDGAIDYLNARIADYTGFAAEELMGDGWRKCLHPDDAARVAPLWLACIATGAPYRVEVRTFHAADSTYRWCVTSAHPLRDQEGFILKWYGNIVDMHDWKQAQEELRSTQAELAHMTRAMTMGELTASIAHEVNQPLAAVVASGDSCLAWLASNPPNLAKVHAAVTRMAQAAMQASEVVQRVRALFKKIPPERAPLRMDEVIEEAVSLVRDEAAREGVSIRVELTPGLPRAAADRVQLQQVILNLIVNGMEAMREAALKQLVIRAGQAEPGKILVGISDSGPGIHPEQANRLFEPFFTTKRDGTGMGLAISRSIIEAHGGRLWVEANEAHGATFQFVLPADTNAV
jgi:PAS domain S-box-containing protein